MARAFPIIVAVVALAAASLRASDAPAADETTLRQMNGDYVRAFLSCDVARFRTLLAEDFSGVLADGRLIDRAEFLRQAQTRPDARDLLLHDVSIREFGETALVGALVTYKRGDGTAVRTRYASVYVRREGTWAIVWVQWTRVAAP